MRKQPARFLALLLAILIVLSGCGYLPTDNTYQQTDATAESEVFQTEVIPEEDPSEQDSKPDLWIMYGTDTKTGYPPVSHFKHVVDQFTLEYPDVNILLESIPQDEESLQRLRTQITEGNIPDVMVMSRNSTLITDPYQAMQNGLFMDISEYYDADTELAEEELHPAIMDAGVYDGHRYIIPYSYDFPVAYVDVRQFESLGGSLDMFDGGIMKLYENLFATGNPKLIWGTGISYPSQRIHSFNCLPELLDYENLEVLITAEEIAQFLKAVQSARATQPFDTEALPYPNFMTKPHLDELKTYGTWMDYTSMYIGVMPEHVTNVGFTKMSGTEIQAIPITAADGDLVADILYYGAVGAGCEKPELAYAFLRTISTVFRNKPPFIPHSIMSFGWPVRITDSAANMANGSRDAFSEFKYFYLDSPFPEITNDDIPFLDAEIDRVHFYTALESDLSDIIDTLNDPSTGAPTDVDIDAVAADFVKELEQHLYEG